MQFTDGQQSQFLCAKDDLIKIIKSRLDEYFNKYDVHKVTSRLYSHIEECKVCETVMLVLLNSIKGFKG